MRAYQVVEFGPPSALRVRDVADPVPGEGQLLVEVAAAGINYPDVLVVSGRYQILPERPFIPGKEIAGVIRAVGPGVAGFAPGDRVLGQLENGAFAEQALVRADDAFKMPSELGFADATAMGLVYQTAYFALRDRASLRRGETVLVGGAAGGVGVAGIQLAKAFGAKVLAAVRRPEQAEFVRACGADVVIDVGGKNLRDDVRAQVFAATDGAGADVVLDPVGADFFGAALRALAWCGRLVVIGFVGGEIPSVKANYLLVKNITVSGLQWSDYRERTPQRMRDAQAEIFDLWRSGALRPPSTKTFTFDRLPEALELIGRGQIQGKAAILLDRRKNS
ncbi:NADPH:quinone oxidoreductase family protein [Bradyrhizobium sp.]|uniref:NADPH:quinone oxidoreductase family protein n=1 Tax=Bradyrhizobium sp. TaxID=376 RepID=UPI0023833253|nr:NADPH:quinone oxidoreductase family protein [Bradyrhizobium sp.]MDE2378459.1 NADPH:quinone oxidoreductase family protein [Bradyrhizobium sp.]